MLKDENVRTRIWYGFVENVRRCEKLLNVLIVVEIVTFKKSILLREKVLQEEEINLQHHVLFL